MLFGELSKYICAQSNSGATTHLAYILPFPDSLQDQIKAFHEKWNTQKSKILTHCCWELMHAVWRLLLDDDFLHAYIYGIIICCANGIEQQVYPQIFTYSDDYPEKYVIKVILVTSSICSNPWLFLQNIACYYLRPRPLPLPMLSCVYVKDRQAWLGCRHGDLHWKGSQIACGHSEWGTEGHLHPWITNYRSCCWNVTQANVVSSNEV